MHTPQLPGFQLVRKLGGGRSFRVWEAAAEGAQESVAVKFPRRSALEKASTIILLRREARAARLVQHPRLIRVLESNFDGDLPFLVMEYMPGESLKDRLGRFGRLSIRRAIWIARQIAEGLAAMHRVGLVHADIKPGNVLLSPRTEVKLIDMGFAHRRGENQKLVDAGFTIGTANYLAPELCVQPVREGPPADLFALGATLFECLTGKVPYPAETAQDAIRLRKRRRALDLTDFRGNWPECVVRAVRSLLAREPYERPTAAAAVRELVRIEVDLMSRKPAPTPAGRSLSLFPLGRLWK
ncbi:MAG TPA: serine/threonine-protein kinase [Urbifossiella sp.]|nr:serine/threonine-protein kinase [Urbifossiella sp.]